MSSPKRGCYTPLMIPCMRLRQHAPPPRITNPTACIIPGLKSFARTLSSTWMMDFCGTPCSSMVRCCISSSCVILLGPTWLQTCVFVGVYVWVCASL